ncbi:MAG: phage tail tape measure protein [Muribaculaceae bacterium]|nr:phage tail tape measure protein [Muribaculaceae bacterium]
MAKQHEYYIKYDSNGAAVIGQLTISAKKLSEAVSAAQTNIKKSFSSITRTFAASSIALNNGVRGLEQLAEPAMEFDEAMRTANTMAGKGAEGFEKLKDQIKELSKEVPIARDVLANGLYQAISNGVPEDNWMSFLEQSARSSVGGIADLGEVVKVTSTVIKNSYICEQKFYKYSTKIHRFYGYI